METKLFEYAKALRLPILRNALNAKILSKKCEAELESIFKEEVELRAENAIKTKIRIAEFPYKKYIADINEERTPVDLKNKLPHLITLDFILKSENVIMIGNPGTGKTHVAIALGIEACNAGYKVKFFHVPTLIMKLKESSSEKRLASFISTFQNYDLIILDELGYVSLDKDGAELLFQLLSSRCELKSTIVTSNNNFDRWVDIFIDPLMTGAIIDRLSFKSHIINMTGESYRYVETVKLNS